jgi:hypothetical protein
MAMMIKDAAISIALLAMWRPWTAATTAHVPRLATITAKDRRVQRRHIARVHLAAGGATLAAAIEA